MQHSTNIKYKIMASITCTTAKQDHEYIQMAHGGGGTLTNKLIDTVFKPAFNNDILAQDHDSAQIELPKGKIAFTTDSFVVDPVFFPGGNIGDLAINGTVNDLLCSGATPKYISVGFIIEEGFPINDLKVIVNTMAQAAEDAGVQIVTGDTKVIEHTKGGQIYINTSGIGVIESSVELSPHKVVTKDKIIVSGLIGEHGTCIMQERGKLGFAGELKSDTASLNNLVLNLLNTTPGIKVIRDPTRGGLSSTLNEIAKCAGVSIEIDETTLPISKSVESLCEILGLDPLYVANEGVMIVFVTPENAEKALEVIKNSKHGQNAAIIGEVIEKNERDVWLKRSFGGKRPIDMIMGEQLPRIC